MSNTIHENGKKILLVEDSKLQASSLAEILSEAGYTTKTAYNGLEGLQMLTRWRPDLIISDVWMPKMNGYEFCKALNSDKALDNIPVILVTSVSNFGNIVKGLGVGADYYLTKPYSKTLLLSMVGSILNKSGQYNGADSDDVSAVLSHDAPGSSRQILNFLFSTYENLLQQNEEITRTKQELRTLNDHLEKRVKEKTDSLQKILNGTVIALARMVEIRDPYTAGHQIRVSQLAKAIGHEMGLSEERCEGVRIVGLLHDIGKIIVPAEILCKPSKLTDYEFRCIKEHSRAGYDILEGIEFPWPVATAVVQHHERLNGSGYPSGLSGDHIIEEAKILAVADVIESMASHRPYRPALGIGLALDEIACQTGILYDPEIAAVALKLFREKNFIFE
jgi:putative two-component system response regulator